MNAALDESVLDSADRLGEADRHGLLRGLATAGAQVRESLALTAEADLAGQLARLRPRAVLLAADAADPAADDAAESLRALASRADAAAPVMRHDGPGPPLWAGATDVVLAVAQSPAEPAVPALADAAARRGLPVLGVGTTGSPLEAACGRNRMPFVGLPSGRHPRVALWGLLTPLLVAAGELGLLGRPAEPGPEAAGPAAPAGPYSVEADLAAAADLLDVLAERARPTSETFLNPAKSLALDLGASLPVLWGTSPVAGAAARRLAGQLAGVARHPAVWETLPGAAQRLGGLLTAPAGSAEDDLFRDRVDDPEPMRPRLVLVRDANEPVDVRRLVEDGAALAGRGGVPVTEVTAEEGGGPLGRFASLVGLLDFTAVYVGLASGADPAGKENP